jgi:hypothetical protein
MCPVDLSLVVHSCFFCNWKQCNVLRIYQIYLHSRFVDALDHLISSWLAVRLFAFQMVAIGEVFQFIVVSMQPTVLFIEN